MKISSIEWHGEIDNCLFYQDLRATLDGVECGQINKSLVDQLCKKNGYKFNWEDYSLTGIH